MNKRYKYILILIVISITFNNIAIAQLDSVMNRCESNLTNEFISDGQQYLSLITGDQVAEFSVLFYGGNTYRVIACGGNEKSDIVFVIYDKLRNELFNSMNFENTSYWDLQFASTVECYVEAKLSDGNDNSGFAVLLIGLKK